MARPDKNNSKLNPGEPHPELRRHFDSEDEALWSVLGRLTDEVDDSGIDRDFVARTLDLARARRESQQPQGRLLLFRRPATWVAASLVAASVAALVFWPAGTNTDSNSGRESTTSVAHDNMSDVLDKEDLSVVLNILSDMPQDALLNLDVAVAEDDDLAWFGK